MNIIYIILLILRYFCENNKKVLTNRPIGAKIGCNLRKWGSYALFMP